VLYKILEDYQRTIMDVKTIPELWGGGRSKNNHCSEKGPNTNPQSFNEKIAVTLVSHLIIVY